MRRWRRAGRARKVVALGALVCFAATSCTAAPAASEPPPKEETTADWAVCGNTAPGPASAPESAVRVEPGGTDLAEQTRTHPAGTTFWLAPGRHTLGGGEFAQVRPKNGNAYVAAPDAVLHGQDVNQYAFTGPASEVTIRHLTIRGFAAPRNEGVVNHDSADGWVIEHNTIVNNAGAALMAGSHQVVRGNCLRDNGQYGINAYQAGSGPTELVVEGNEIVGNNTADWEAQVSGCGCTGGVKFWSVDGAVVRNNWVHDNHGPGLWGDTNNNDFVIENNLITGNDSAAVIYETSYNAIIRSNVIRGNGMVTGKEVAAEGDAFPEGAIYVSESGGEPRIPARTDKIAIYDNVLRNNWSGITLWENADRFCNSPANTSTGDCTLLVGADATQRCSRPEIANQPLYDECRWKTKRVDVHDNTFVYEPEVVGCARGFPGRMAVLSNYGTYPDWSPYKQEVIRDAVTFEQHNRWHHNSYYGPWSFVAYEMNRSVDWQTWRDDPYGQDSGSTFQPDAAQGEC